jgi:Putative transposase
MHIFCSDATRAAQGRRMIRHSPLMAQAFTALTRVFMQETLAWYERSAAEHGIPKGRGAAVSVQHRFGGALNLNCHVHAAVIDGVFTRGEKNERAVFHPVRAPDSFALGLVIERVYKRLVKWLRSDDLLAQYTHQSTWAACSWVDKCWASEARQRKRAVASSSGPRRLLARVRRACS